MVEYLLAVLPVLWPLTESAMNRWVSDPLMALIAVPLALHVVRHAADEPRHVRHL